MQRVLVDITDVDSKADLGGQVDESVAAGRRRGEPIMINDVVPSVEDSVEDLDRVSGRRKLIMNYPADETSAAGE